MELKEGWEKKALIAVGVVVVIIVLYAYFNPFTGTSNNTTQSVQVTPTPAVPVPYLNPTTNNSTSNNSSTNTGNLTLTSAQAQNIALNANPGYSAGLTTQGTISINGINYSIWNVTINNPNSPSKSVIVDSTSGRILQTT
jgi:hypothetical protein